VSCAFAEISREAGRVGLVMNPDKTKYMRFSASPSRRSVKGGNHKWCNFMKEYPSSYTGVRKSVMIIAWEKKYEDVF
jgi:hypothetical protein